MHGNFSKIPSTSTRFRLAQLVVASSSMQSQPLNIPGITVWSKVSTLALPLTPTAASSWSMLTPRAKSSQLRLSFDISTSPSLRLPLRIGSSTACKVSQGPSREPHLPRVSPNLRLLPIFRTFSNCGTFLHYCLSGPPAFPLQHIQGWTRRHFQGWLLPRPQIGPPPLPTAWCGVLHCIHPLTRALSCLHPQHFKLHPGILTVIMRNLQGW